jgi:diguanylate cyclase (GGDEF)-like protein/PAS domain S-box-containing protein
MTDPADDLAPPAPLPLRRALIVDDDPLARTLVGASFTDLGFDVTTAADGDEALALAAATRFDCVVLDVQMPGPSGFEVCRQLRRLPAYRSTPILIQTGLEDHDSVEQAFEAGASDYLTKPVNDALLRHRVRFVMKSAEVVTELESNRAKLNEALDLAQLGHWEYAYATRIIQTSDVHRRVLHLPGPVPRSFYLSRIHPDDRELVRRQLQSVGVSTDRIDFAHRWLAPDGRQLVLHVQGALRRDAEGQPETLVGSIQDVTEREAILEKMRLWSKVIESSVEGMLLVDAGLLPLQVNAAFTRLTGLDLDGLRQRGWDFFDEAFRRQVLPVLRTAGTWQGERTTHGPDGAIQHHWVNVGVLPGPTGMPSHFVVMISDVSALRRYQSRLDYLARHDPLTGLLNRAAMLERLHEQAVAVSTSGGRLGLLYLDLDRFKNVNDALGQGWGDRFLVAVVERLRAALPATALLGRPESDEFLVMIPRVGAPTEAVALAERLLDALQAPLRVDDYEFVIGASAGIAFLPQHAANVEDLVKNASIAMHQAKARKAQGRGRYQLFSSRMAAEITDRVSLEARIRAGLARGEFRVHYQPKIELATGLLVGAEALVRWEHPEEGPIAPARFVPVAESAGLIAELGRWVFQETAAQMKRWDLEGLPVAHVAVNVAGPQVWRGDFLQHIRDTLREVGVAPGRLQIEITETLIMRDSTRDETVLRMNALRDLGLTLAIDDFGTGYSSLSRLKRLPVATLKIDQSFVRDVVDDPNDAAIVRAIIAMARTLGLATVAEGVETEGQLAWLRAEGCDIGQGFLFGRARPADEFAAQLRAGLLGGLQGMGSPQLEV